MAVLIDTDVLIEAERSTVGAIELHTITQYDVGGIASITASELLVGVLHANTEERRVRRESLVETLLSQLTILPFDLAAARIYARVGYELTATGQKIGAHDLMIASTAIAYDLELLTANTSHFGRIPGLTVRHYGSAY
jgi:predicted nucleic acid-binding protein